MIWLEVGSWWHWSPSPSGIIQTCQKLYLASLKRKNVRYFVYDRNFNKFFELEDHAYLKERLHKRGEVLQPPKFGRELISQVKRGDKIFFVGGPWEYPLLLPCLKELRAKGAWISILVYDLIPMLFPKFFPKGFSRIFADLIGNLMPCADEFVAISRSTEADLIRYASRLKKRIRTRVLRLGEPEKHFEKPKRPKHRLRKDYVLNVSTIEIRKNHDVLLKAWKLLDRKLGTKTPQLVLVGGKGWLADGMYKKLKTDPVARRHIKILHNIPNREIPHFYSSCLFTVYPSFYEGWGLPIAESLSYGKLCLCSNTSSMKEIAPSLTETFNPRNARALAELVEHYVSNPAERQSFETRIREVYAPQSWETTYRNLVEGPRK